MVPAAVAAASLSRPPGGQAGPAGPARGLAGEEPTVDGVATAGSRAFLGDLFDGWREFTKHSWIWVMVAGAAVFLFAIAWRTGISVLARATASRAGSSQPST